MSNSVPVGWSLSRLSDLANIRSSNVDKKSSSDEIPVRLCNYTDVYYNNQITSKIKFMEATAKQNQIDRFSIQAGDVIITKDSETPDDIAIPAYVAESFTNVLCGYHLSLIRPEKDKASGSFLSHLFGLASVRHHFYILANGITRYGLNIDAIENAPILAPPLAEQQKIAAILTSVDDVIESTQSQINKLKDLKTGMMQELLTKGIGRGGLPYSEFKDSPVGRIPKEWEVVKLSDVLEKIDSGWSPNCIETPPNIGEWGVLKVSSVTRDVFLEEQSKVLPKELEPRELARVKAGDILLTRANGVADLVGKCVMVMDEPKRKLMMSDKILRLKPNEKIDRNFLLHSFNSALIRRQIEFCWGGSSGQKNIGQSDIKDFVLPLPSLKEQVSIGKAISQIDNYVSQKSRKLESLQSTKKALMQDLLTGKVRVKVN